MPGVLSSIFDPAGEEAGSSQSSVVTGEGGIDLVVDQQVGLDLGVTYEDADGATHSWQMENDIGVHADVGATVSTILTSDQGSMSMDE